MSSGPTPTGEALAGYPTQRHAGKVGYGPNYKAGASVLDKVEGLAEEVAGKVTHNPKLVSEGHEKYTGEMKRKKLLGETQEDSPFDSTNEISAEDTKAKITGQHSGRQTSGVDIHDHSPAAATSRGLEETGSTSPPSYSACKEM